MPTARTKKKESTAKTTKVKKTKKVVEAKSAVNKTPSKKVKEGGKPCKISGCKRHYRAKGYCKAHYKKWRHSKYGRARWKHCSERGCALQMARNRHGLCEEHYQKYFVRGEAAPVVAPAEQKPAAAAG